MWARRRRGRPAIELASDPSAALRQLDPPEVHVEVWLPSVDQELASIVPIQPDLDHILAVPPPAALCSVIP